MARRRRGKKADGDSNDDSANENGRHVAASMAHRDAVSSCR